jgi:hypothetical protein
MACSAKHAGKAGLAGGNATAGVVSRTPQRARAAYAELHCLSNFTFLRGASHP